MENLFIRQCSALIETMLFCKKEQETRELIMLDWVEPNQCGYAACVLGHHATMSEVAPFIVFPFINTRKHRYIRISAVEFAGQLVRACSELFSNAYLALSIYEGTYMERRSYARVTNLFTDEEIENLNHLNKEPDYDDVVEYLELVIHKTEQRIEELL